MTNVRIGRLDKASEKIELPKEFDGLPVFVVGGWVRSVIRGVGPSDIDLLVAEVTPEEMEERGFRLIDNENNDTFAVFQDSMGREVAIAREEFSTGDGHREFDVTPVPADVQAREALLRDAERRDITINSLILDLRHNVLHDPHGGFQDLQDGVIRAVSSDSFKQDPLRLVRGCRFAARLEFEIEPTTKELMSEAVEGLNDLPNERLAQELEKALVQADEPSRFFRVLDEIGALETTFPELAALKFVAAGPDEYHGEMDSYVHTMMVLDEMKNLRPEDEIGMLMAIVHDLGKAETPEEDLPSHPGHSTTGMDIADDMANRLSMSNEKRKAMKEASRDHMALHDIEEMRASSVIGMWQRMDHPYKMIDLAIADKRGREPEQEADKGIMLKRFGAARDAIEEWTGQRLIEEGYDPKSMGGKEFGDLLRQKRTEYMRELESDQ